MHYTVQFKPLHPFQVSTSMKVHSENLKSEQRCLTFSLIILRFNKKNFNDY
jgi:hypothetical protein